MGRLFQNSANYLDKQEQEVFSSVFSNSYLAGVSLGQLGLARVCSGQYAGASHLSRGQLGVSLSQPETSGVREVGWGQLGSAGGQPGSAMFNQGQPGSARSDGVSQVSWG